MQLPLIINRFGSYLLVRPKYAWGYLFPLLVELDLFLLMISVLLCTHLLSGRLLVGLGGNRAVNRRYIADFVPVKDRTYHSALFGKVLVIPKLFSFFDVDVPLVQLLLDR